MKGLTLTPPWGTLVAIGAKRIETRSWPTKYRGPIAIHQAKGLNGLHNPGYPWEPQWALRSKLVNLCEREPYRSALRPHLSGYTPEERAADLPRGAIVAIAKLVDCVPTERVNFAMKVVGIDQPHLVEQEQAFGDFTPGRHAWLLQRVLNLYDGIECSGGRGLWDVPDDVLNELFAFDDIDDLYNG